MTFIYNMESSYNSKFDQKEFIGVPNPKKYRGFKQYVLIDLKLWLLILLV